MRFEAPNRLFLKLPTLGEGKLVPRTVGGSFRGELVDVTFDVLGGICQLVRPIVAEKLQQYVMQGYFVSAPEANQSQSTLLLTFAYGIPTPPSALPASGAADYAMSYNDKGFAFHADYATKAITGTIPFFVNGPTLSSQLKEVVISADGASFSGRLLPPDGSPEGTIQGMFMGPSGEEFIALTVLKSGQTISIFSGTRQP
ncbi:hypothetical protein [Tsuneonella deserti]|nr:hypothetical protein [Tsuneonella deserti]